MTDKEEWKGGSSEEQNGISVEAEKENKNERD